MFIVQIQSFEFDNKRAGEGDQHCSKNKSEKVPFGELILIDS